MKNPNVDSFIRRPLPGSPPWFGAAAEGCIESMGKAAGRPAQAAALRCRRTSHEVRRSITPAACLSGHTSNASPSANLMQFSHRQRTELEHLRVLDCFRKVISGQRLTSLRLPATNAQPAVSNGLEQCWAWFGCPSHVASPPPSLPTAAGTPARRGRQTTWWKQLTRYPTRVRLRCCRMLGGTVSRHQPVDHRERVLLHQLPSSPAPSPSEPRSRVLRGFPKC